jgi:hypothetical protein
MAPFVGLALLLAACSPSGGAAVSGPPGVGPQLTDADMPHPKPGLWDVKSAAAGERQTCLSGPVLTVFAARPGCTQISRQRTADGGLVMDSQCSDDTGVSHTNVSATGDFQSAFSVTLAASASLKSGANMPSMTDHMDYRYLGDCPAGRHPDDQS